MDLLSMLNEGPAEEKKNSAPQASPPAQGHTIDYAPSTSASQARGRGLTPLQTPLQTPGGGQYSYPGPQQQHGHPQQQPAQSPISGPPHRPYDAYAATTPVGRPPSQSFQFAQPSPSHYQANHHAQHTMSMSPTPPSHHSQTPHSVRQSPLATTMGYPPPLQQQQSFPPPFHHSQPSTPLGPPPPLIGRHPTQLDMSSPYHQRTHSGASNGMVAGSPAQHNLSIGNLVESPSANYHRPSSTRRSTSDYMSSADRDRSVSVSPKTKVPMRQPSSGSRHSSQQESYSARSSMQPSASVASQIGTPGRVQAAAPIYAQPPVNSGFDDSLSARNGMPNNNYNGALPSLQHQPQKMDMHHLLSPTEHGPSQQHSQQQNLQQSQPQPQQSPPQIQPQPNLTLPTTAPPDQRPRKQSDSHPMPPLKRAAASPPVAEPPSKRGRPRKYVERPIWAHLHPNNPRLKEPGLIPNSSQQATLPNVGVARTPQPQPQPQPQQNGHQMPQPNGNGPHNALLDNDLIRARRILDPNWERSMEGHVPITSLVKQVMDWLYVSLDENSDIGLNAREGAIEIEAKIGTLIEKKTGARVSLPITSATVIHPQFNDKLQFESQMLQAAHKKMNEFLNRITQTAATTPGRKRVEYTHTRETDSFRTLNQAGMNLMPEALMKRNNRRDLKLRTSRRDTDGAITGRIVKLPLSQLQIHSPMDNYDVRISMNLEVNLDQPELETLDITDNPTQDRPAQPERKKDRVSYKHLACQTDLTRVDTPGLGPKYELELELDANVLRHQKMLLGSGQENGFQAVVEGFMDNLTLLMRQPKQ